LYTVTGHVIILSTTPIFATNLNAQTSRMRKRTSGRDPEPQPQGARRNNSLLSRRHAGVGDAVAVSCALARGAFRPLR